MSLVQAHLEHLDALAPLFHQYRQEMGYPSHLPTARHYLFDRLLKHEVLIWLSVEDETNQPLGFAMVYPSYSSLTLQDVWVCSDLYVAQPHRQQGHAQQLLQAVQTWFETLPDAMLVAHPIPVARPYLQKLLHANGFKRGDQFDAPYRWLPHLVKQQADAAL